MGILDDFNLSFDWDDDKEKKDAVTDNSADAPSSVPATNPGSDTPLEMSDGEVDDVFAALTQQINNDEDVIAATAAIFAAEKAVADKEAEYTKAFEERKRLNDEIAEAERLITEKKRQAHALNNIVFEKHRDKNRAQQTFVEKQRAAEIAKEAVENGFKARLAGSSYERIAKNFDWFNGIHGKKVLPHQWTAMQFLATAQRAILGDGMGVGKTLSSIGALDIAEAKRVLIITPADITTNFVNEIQYWAGHRPVLNLRGESKVSRESMLRMMDMLESFTIVVNYEAWRKDSAFLVKLADLGFDTIIMDEAHTIKDTASNAYRGIKQLTQSQNYCYGCKKVVKATDDQDMLRTCACGWSYGKYHEASKELVWDERYWTNKSVQRIWAMTGTPILNAPQDLFALLSIIDPINFDNKNAYLREYAQLDQYTGKWGFRSGGVGSLMKRLSSKFMARTMHDAGIVLPEQKPIVHEVLLDPIEHKNQIKVIKQITEHAQIVLSEEKSLSIPAIIALITRQRQANVWPGGIEMKDPDTGEIVWRVSEDVRESVKMDKAVELIKEYTAQGERIVVFSQFSTALRELHARINLSRNDNDDTMFSVVFDGSTPQNVRSEIKTNFDKKMGEDKKWDVVMANYKTGGTGLNLTAATHTIILDREWNPGKENQALARTLRIGQDKETFVHIIEIPGTIDQWLNSIIDAKNDMIGGFNNAASEITDLLRKSIEGK